MIVRRFLPLVLLAATSACVSHEPRLQLPTNVEAKCEHNSVKQTAIEAIVASTDDTIQPGTYPGDAAMRKIIQSVGGAFAYWPAQPLRAPNTAKALGLDGDYLTLVRAVVTNQVDVPNHARPVWLTFKTPSGEKTVLEKAHDIQDVCIEGQPEP